MTIDIDKDVLRRLRTNRNVSIENLSKWTHIDELILRAYENETHSVSLADAECIAKALRISWLALLDTELEEPKQFGNDNRNAKHKHELLDVEIQEIMSDVEYLLELSSEFNPEAKFGVKGYTVVPDNPDASAARLRRVLHINEEALAGAKDDYAVWNFWKEVFARQGLYVFERSWDASTVRAFSLRREGKSAAVVSTKDVPLGRVFSLLHEVYHLLLRQDAICDLHTSKLSSDIEVMCNQFAASFLMPAGDFTVVAHGLGLRQDSQDNIEEHDVKAIQSRFKASRLSVYRRLLTLGYISRKLYETVQDEYDGFEKPKKKSSGGSKEIYYRTRLNGVGKLFASELMSAYADRQITALNLANILKVRVSQLGEVNSLMGGNGKGS